MSKSNTIILIIIRTYKKEAPKSSQVQDIDEADILVDGMEIENQADDFNDAVANENRMI